MLGKSSNKDRLPVGGKKHLDRILFLQYSLDTILVIDKTNNLLTPSEAPFVLGLMLRVKCLTPSIYLFD